jgi:hypothetical protein
LKDHAAISLADLLETPPPMSAVMDEVEQQFFRVFEYERGPSPTGEAE